MPMQSPSPGALAGIDLPLIRAIVDTFYARVRADALLGPVFEAAVEDWPSHLDKLCAFWSSVTMMTGSYKGQPMQAHLRLPGLSDDHFRRWIDLFGETVRDLCTPEQAGVFMTRAARIADSFRFGIGSVQGRIVQPLFAR